jgi:hypothetical protein
MSINRASNYEDQLLLRQQLEQFGEKYGYPVMTGESMSWDDLVAQTKHFMRRHNTFARGVGDNPQIPLRTREARLRHAATTPHVEGGGL